MFRKITKREIDLINSILKEIKKNKLEIEDVVNGLCPFGKEEYCDAEVVENKDALKCEYFPLCNILTSYFMLSDEKKEEYDEMSKRYRELRDGHYDNKRRRAEAMFS